MKFLQDRKGNNSSLRLAMIAWIFGSLIVWAIVSLWHGSVADIPGSVVGLVTAMLTAKVFQKHAENKEPE